MTKPDKFVASSNVFDTLEDAERKVTGWLHAGKLEQKMRLFKVVKTYVPVIKFEEIKQ